MFFQQLHFKVQPHIIKRPPTKKKTHAHLLISPFQQKKTRELFRGWVTGARPWHPWHPRRPWHPWRSFAWMHRAWTAASSSRMDQTKRSRCAWDTMRGPSKWSGPRAQPGISPVFEGGNFGLEIGGGQRVSFKNRGRFKVTTWGLAKHHSLPLWHPPLRHQKKSSGSFHYAHLFDKHPVIQVTQVLPKFLSKAVSAAEKWFQDTKWTSTIVIDGVMGPL